MGHASLLQTCYVVFAAVSAEMALVVECVEEMDGLARIVAKVR